LTIGQAEILQYASTGVWNMIYDYPGTDSADGCGANSDYSVTYSVSRSAPLVTVPNLVGKTAAAAVQALTAAKLAGLEEVVKVPQPDPGIIFRQTPSAHTLVAEHTAVTYYLGIPNANPK
jgi:beta-lactam-binding protein with PASTA domain